MKTLLLSIILLVGCPEYEITIKPVKKPNELEKVEKLIQDLKKTLVPGETLVRVEHGGKVLYQSPLQYQPAQRIIVRPPEPPLYLNDLYNLRRAGR